MAKGDRTRTVLASALARALTPRGVAAEARAWLPVAIADGEVNNVLAAVRVHALFGAWDVCAVPEAFDVAMAREVWRARDETVASMLEAPGESVLAHALATTDRHAVRRSLDADGGGTHDRMARMFEHVLAAKNAGQRARRGVFYTPQPLVDYVLASVAARGPTGPFTLWDPAAGTGAFVRAAATRFRDARVIAWELDPSTLAVAHLQRALVGDTSPLTWRLGDALSAFGDVPAGPDPLVVIGNPPFAGHSKNRGARITELLRGRDPLTAWPCASYFHVDGVPLGERNPKWVQDDYVKFIRLAHWAVVRAGAGVVALVTGHGFFSQPTFRAMRHALLRDFDEVWCLDLHGNAKKFETARGDQNVFEIGTGVGMVLLVRHADRGTTTVHHAERWGTRAEKHAWLATHDVTTTTWTVVTPHAPAFCFVPRDDRLREEYDRGFALPELFPVFTVGVVTGDDARHVALDRHALIDPVPCLYRPFDRRWLHYDHAALERSRRAVMPAMMAPGALALIARRQSPAARAWTYVFAAREIVVDGAIRSDNHGSETVFPLWLADGTPNLSAAVISHLERAWQRTWSAHRGPGADGTFTVEDVASYVYAVLHAPSYRTRYASLLQTAFPRVPFTHEPLDRVLALGRTLLTLHTAPSDVGAALSPGDSIVTAVRWEADAVWINATQHFAPVESRVWTFAIGGYEPARKWLLDRRGSALHPDDALHYGRIVGALRETARVMGDIDACVTTQSA